MDWKTFAGQYQDELTALTLTRAQKDMADISNKAYLSEYFRDHLERGIGTLQNTKGLSTILKA
jgi:DNA sulfur modification protein DndE